MMQNYQFQHLWHLQVLLFVCKTVKNKIIQLNGNFVLTE